MVEPVAPAVVPVAPVVAPVEPVAPVVPPVAVAPAEVVPPVVPAEPGKEPVAPVAPDAPKEFKLIPPENSHFTAEALEARIASYKEQGLTNEQAQKVVNDEHEAVSSFAKWQQENLEVKKTEWKNSSAADPEIGGADYGKNAELAKRVVDRYATPEFKAQMDATGFGNHPEVMRTFIRIGKAMAEDQLVISNGPSAPKKSTAEKLYPSKGEKSGEA